MLSKIRDKQLYCGLDVGAQRIKAGILRAHDHKRMELAGVYEARTRGFKDSAITDLGEFSDCLYSTLEELSRRTGIRIEEVHLGLGGDLIDVRFTNTVIPLADSGHRMITKTDVKHINNQARLLGVMVEEEVLHNLPQYYKVDDADSAMNPVGLYGRKLGVHSLMIVTNSARLRNIVQAVVNIGYDVPTVSFSSFVASQVVLSASDKQDGCVFIDVGSSVTMILIYKDYVLKQIARVDFGGDDITQGLAEALDIPFDTAEEVKRSYGSILEDDVEGGRDILVRTDYGHISLKSREVCQACLKKTDILIGKIREAIGNSGLKDQILGSVTLAGGAALLSGFSIRLQEALQRSVKLGQVQGAEKTLKNVVSFSSVLGLAYHGYHVYNESVRKSPEDGALMKRWTEKVKILYQQYF